MRSDDGLTKRFVGAITANSPLLILGAVVAFCVMAFVVYSMFRIDVPEAHVAVLIHNTGKDITNADELAPSPEYKGIQKDVLREGRYFKDPWNWSWEIHPMPEVAKGNMGVLVRLFGEDLGYGEFVATSENHKGIVPEVLRAGRHPINPYMYRIETEHEPVVIPAGFRGVVTNLSGPMPDNPNLLLVEKGKRGVQEETLGEGTYYLNPYMCRVNLIDCRSQRFTVSDSGSMGFPSKDGFWVTMDGVIEFRIKPEMASEVFVTYNDDTNGDEIDKEIVDKIILPNARSFCRLRGSSKAGREFIGGETRQEFQAGFQEVMQEACEPEGIEIIQALVTKIKPPEAIAGPIRDREVTKQKLAQYTQQIAQQESEQLLAKEEALIEQRKELVDAEREVVQMTVKAKQEQQVAITKANEQLGVAKFRLEAARDDAEAIKARKEAEAKVIVLRLEAEAEGWKRSVAALGGDGMAFARNLLYAKLAPAYRSVMVNTADSPLMEVFRGFVTDNANEQPTPKKTN